MSSSQEDQECEASAENESNWSESVNDTDSGFKDDTETESIDNRSDEEGEDSDHAWKNEDSNKNKSKNCDDPSKKVGNWQIYVNITISIWSSLSGYGNVYIYEISI